MTAALTYTDLPAAPRRFRYTTVRRFALLVYLGLICLAFWQLMVIPSWLSRTGYNEIYYSSEKMSLNIKPSYSRFVVYSLCYVRPAEYSRPFFGGEISSTCDADFTHFYYRKVCMEIDHWVVLAILALFGVPFVPWRKFRRASRRLG
jgi:hypothetical protein